MIFKSETSEQKRDRLRNWRKWFAWRPVFWNGGWAWLSFVECRMEARYGSWDWEYREIPKTIIKGNSIDLIASDNKISVIVKKNMILLLISLSCIKPTLINNTKFPWNSFDKTTLKRANKRCKEIYKDAPCLKYFIKTAEKDYRAVCSKSIDKR